MLAEGKLALDGDLLLANAKESLACLQSVEGKLEGTEKSMPVIRDESALKSLEEWVRKKILLQDLVDELKSFDQEGEGPTLSNSLRDTMALLEKKCTGNYSSELQELAQWVEGLFIPENEPMNAGPAWFIQLPDNHQAWHDQLHTICVLALLFTCFRCHRPFHSV